MTRVSFRRRLAVVFAALGLLVVAPVGRPTGASAQGPDLVDRIVAIVDDEPILQSDLDREVESYKFELSQTGQAPTEDDAAIRKKMLQRLIDVKLLVAQAKLDEIEVTDDEIDQAVARSLDEVISRFGTKSKLQQELARNGMTFADLEARNRDLIRNRLYTNRMISMHIRPLIEVREDEIRAFYEKHLDEIPTTPAAVEVSNILVVPQPDPAVQKALELKLDAIKAALESGEDFGEVAKRFSEGPNAARGGLVGSFARGDLFNPVLEELAWSIPVGKISQPVSTELGMHIVQVTQRTEKEVTLRQILLRVTITAEDWERARQRAQEIYEKARAGQDFAELVKKYSDDPSSRENGGKLGTFPEEKLTSDFRRALKGLQPNQVAPPVKGTAGYFVLRLDARVDPQRKSYEEIHDQLRAMVEDQKIQTELDKFLKGLRRKFYIDIKG